MQPHNGRRIREERIRFLFECASLGTMRAAAEKLNVDTSSVSRQVSRLEQEVGHPLYEKRRQKFQLTEVGKILFDYYRRRLVDYEQLNAELDQVGALKTGSVDIALSEGLVANLISPAMAKFSRQYPGIQINATVHPTTRAAVNAILNDDAHFGIIFDPPGHPHIRTVRTIPQPLCAITQPSDPIADKARCRLQDLMDRKILLNQDNQLFEIIESGAAMEGLRFEPTITSNSLTLLADCIRNGAGISILSELSVAQYLQQATLAATPIDNALFESSIAALVTRLGRQLPKSTRAFLRQVQRNL